MTHTDGTSKRKQFWLTWGLGTVILVPCMIGFSMKFIELLVLCKQSGQLGPFFDTISSFTSFFDSAAYQSAAHTAKSSTSDAIFAFTPVINYLLAGAGFFMFFWWAILHGMFVDIEKPKLTMLEIEAKLDHADDRLWQSSRK